MERFWSKVDRSPDCWVWTGAVNDRNRPSYGRIRIDGRTRYTHRLSWEMHHGPVPAGMEVCHTCDNPPCVRPDHLFLGTTSDNQQDACRKGRNRRRLNPGAVLIIRELADRGVTGRAMAPVFGVSEQTISMIVRRRTWTCV